MHVDDAFLERMAEKRLLQLSNVMTQTLQEQYPKSCRILGKEQLKTFCEQCATKAYNYGANNLGEYKIYTFLAWELGIGFDDDPLYPWIADMLKQDEPFEIRIEEIRNRVNDRFCFKTLNELQAYDEVLKRLLRLNFSTIKGFTSYVDIINTLENVYPQRVESLGGREIVKESLKHACHQKPIRYNINHPIGIFIYAGLVFFLGHKVDDDPLFGWVKKYLNDDEPRMAHKIDRLVKVIEKRIRNMRREIKVTMEDLR